MAQSNRQQKGAPPAEAISPEAVLHRMASLERAVDALSEQLEESSHLTTLGLLSAVMAHELRNVLTPVLSYAQLAKSKPDDPQAAGRAIERAVAGIEAASEIIDSTLSMARPTKAHAEERATVRQAFDDALRLLPRDPHRDAITIDNHLPADVCVAMQPGALNQVFVNLLFNAWEALRGFRCTREKRIVARVDESAHEPDRVVIALEDNGPGLPPELVNRVFEPFITTHATRTPTCGSGLGLMICRQLVERAGGNIRVESQPGEGATFYIELNQARPSLRKAG